MCGAITLGFLWELCNWVKCHLSRGHYSVYKLLHSHPTAMLSEWQTYKYTERANLRTHQLPKHIISSFNFLRKPKNSILANIIKSVYYILSEVVSLSHSRTKGIQKWQFQYNWNLMCLCPLHNRLFGPSISRFFMVIDFLTGSTINAYLSKVWHFRGVQMHSPGFPWNLWHSSK